MSCLLYGFNSYKYLCDSSVIQEVNKDMSVKITPLLLYYLNVAAYKARYKNAENEDLSINPDEEIDYEFKDTDMDNPISVFKLFSRIDYQLCDLRCNLDLYNKFNDDYDTFKVVWLSIAEQIIKLAEHYHKLYLDVLNGNMYRNIIKRAAELAINNKG